MEAELSFLFTSAWTRDGKIIHAPRVKASDSLLAWIHLSATPGFTRILESWHPILLSSEIRPYRLLSPQLSLQRKISVENEDEKLVNQSDSQIKKTLIEYHPQFSWHLYLQILIVDVVFLFKAVMVWCLATIWGDTLQGNRASSWVFHIWVNVSSLTIDLVALWLQGFYKWSISEDACK